MILLNIFAVVMCTLGTVTSFSVGNYKLGLVCFVLAVAVSYFL